MTKTCIATGLLLCLSAAPALAGPVFGQSSYASSFTITGSTSTAMGVAYSGGNYYGVSGGSPSSPEYEYNASGSVVAGGTAPNPGIDFRSIFTDASGAVYARGYNSSTIYRQTSFGQFSSYVTLAGGLDAQEAVVLDSSGTQYVGNDNGVAQIWNLNGTLQRTVTLAGNSGINIAAYGGDLLSFNNGVVSAYSEVNGALLDSTTLIGATNQHYSASYANGYFFIANASNNGYQGYLIGQGTPVPEPVSIALLGGALLPLGVCLTRRKTDGRNGGAMRAA